MPERETAAISLRKHPKQARSNALVSHILEAAVQVLAREGARRFTTARVAERAGVSVGSLYQYFPNKGAILFRLQAEEWSRTAAMLQDILRDASRPPLERLRALVGAFIRSECEEADMRGALEDAAPLYRDAPEAREARASADGAFRDFLREALPEAPAEVRDTAEGLIRTTLGAAGKQFSRQPRTPAEQEAFAGAMGDMFEAYLQRLGADPAPAGPARDRP